MEKTEQTQPDVNSTKVLTKKSKKSFKITKPLVLFTIFVIAWAVLATVAAQYIVALPMVMILGSAAQQPGWMLIYYILTYAITLLLILVVPIQAVKLYRKRHSDKNTKALDKLEKDLAVTPEDMGTQQMPTFIDIGLAPVGYVAYLIIAAVLTNLMSLFTWFNASESQDVGFGYFITDLDRIWAMLAVVIIAPVAEELIMRGWLYGKLRRKWSVLVAMILTSLAFAVLHGQWNVGVSVFALSMVLCTLREITGTIWSGMLLHILSNGIAFYLLYIAI